MSTYLSGFLISISLIIAIGAQNAFVLKQGLKKQYVFLVCFICATSDAILIVIGVSGFSVLITTTPWLESVARYGGAIFLIVYSVKSFFSAFNVSKGLEPSQDSSDSVYKIILICLAFTWLNPHVYLDTVVFLGSVSSQFPEEKLQFIFGAISASFFFFFSLGYGARGLIPMFKKPIAWKILDIAIGVFMLIIAVILLF